MDSFDGMALFPGSDGLHLRFPIPVLWLLLILLGFG